MASKTHCDICDTTPALDQFNKTVPVPGKPHWDKSRLIVQVTIAGVHYRGRDDDEVPNGNKDVCDDCRRKLVADAFGLRTSDEYNALRDELQATIEVCREELTALRAAAGQEEPPAEPVAEPDIPF